MLTTFLRRIAAQLDAGTYEEVEADRTATPHAFLVVLLSSLAAGLGLCQVFGLISPAPGVTAALATVVSGR